MKKQYEIKDSGEREEYPTGARRDLRERKGRFDLFAPIAMFRLAKWYEMGADKYGDHNWEKGMPSSRYLDSAFRHMYKAMAGLEDEDHWAAACWNIMAIIWNETHRPDLHDIPYEAPDMIPFSLDML